MAQDAAEIVQEAPSAASDGPRGLRTAQDGPRKSPTRPPRWSQTPQEGPNRTPGWLKCMNKTCVPPMFLYAWASNLFGSGWFRRPRRAQGMPQRVQRGPLSCPKAAQDGPKTAEEGLRRFRTAQKSTKTALRGRHEGPERPPRQTRGPQDSPRQPQDGPRVPRKSRRWPQATSKTAPNRGPRRLKRGVAKKTKEATNPDHEAEVPRCR